MNKTKQRIKELEDEIEEHEKETGCRCVTARCKLKAIKQTLKELEETLKTAKKRMIDYEKYRKSKKPLTSEDFITEMEIAFFNELGLEIKNEK